MDDDELQFEKAEPSLAELTEEIQAPVLEEKRVEDPSGDSMLSRYFREMAMHSVMTHQEEVAAAIAVEKAEACDGGFDIGVQHLASLPTATAVAERLASSLGVESIPVDEVGAAIGAHVGPGMISVTITPR